MSKLFKFDKKDRKIRKNWLLATTLYYVGVPIVALFISFLFDTITPELMGEVAGFIGFWWISHCAYKKHGYLLLTWWLIIGPLIFLADIVEISRQHGGAVALIGTVICVPFYIWWYVASLRLRKVNIRLEPQVNAISEYLNGIYALRKSTCLDSLEVNYRSLLKKWPKYEEASLEEYKKIKTCLSNADLPASKEKEIGNPKPFKRVFNLLRGMTNHSNSFKRGVSRLGIVLGSVLSLLIFIISFLFSLLGGTDFLTIFPKIVFIVIPLTLLGFIIPIFLAKAIGWIVQGFQKS